MQERLNCYMNPYQKWLSKWRLRRIIVALTGQVSQGASPHVMEFAKALEATELMTRGLKKDTAVSIQVERAQLSAFIRYMCSLHDAKLSRIMLARIGLATLFLRDESALQQPAKEVLEQEMDRTKKGSGEVVDTVGKQLNLKI